MIKFIARLKSNIVLMFALVAVLNSIQSLLMATLMSGLFDEEIFIEFYATLNASLLGITLSQFGLGNVMLAFRDEIECKFHSLIATWSVTITPVLVGCYLLLFSVYLNLSGTSNIDLVAVGFYTLGRANWLSFQSGELILRSFRFVILGLVIQVTISLILLFIMYNYGYSVSCYFISAGVVSYLIQLILNGKLPDLAIIKLEYIYFAGKNVFNSLLITFFTIGDKIFANTMLDSNNSSLSDYYNASIVVGYFYFIVNVFSNWWGSIVSKNWNVNREMWRSRSYIARNFLWLFMLVPIFGSLILSARLFTINSHYLFLLTGLVLGLNLCIQAMMKYTQGIVLMHRDMGALVKASVLGLVCFILWIVMIKGTPALLLSLALCISSSVMLFYQLMRIKYYDF